MSDIEKLERELTILFCVKYSSLTGRELQQTALRVVEAYFEPQDCDQYLTTDQARRELGKKLVAELGLLDIIDDAMTYELSNLLATKSERYDAN